MSTCSICVWNTQKLKAACKFVAHETLVTNSNCFGDVFKVANSLSHFLKIFMFSFKSHTPVFYQWTTPKTYQICMIYMTQPRHLTHDISSKYIQDSLLCSKSYSHGIQNFLAKKLYVYGLQIEGVIC